MLLAWISWLFSSRWRRSRYWSRRSRRWTAYERRGPRRAARVGRRLRVPALRAAAGGAVLGGAGLRADRGLLRAAGRGDAAARRLHGARLHRGDDVPRAGRAPRPPRPASGCRRGDALEGLRPRADRLLGRRLDGALPDPAHTDAASLQPERLPLGQLGPHLQ